MGNPHDPYAGAVLETGVTVGRVPREISAVCSTFLGCQGRIICEVTAPNRNASGGKYPASTIHSLLSALLR